MPGIRAFLFVAAGASRLPVLRTVLLGGLSALIWNALLLAAGTLVARNVGDLLRLVDRYMWGAGGVMVAAAGALLGRALWRRRQPGRA
jgi:membrane protein DedA with SNARE-associated domain